MKTIYKIVLTGGPAAGKTTLISRILKEFKQEDGWRVITIPETATDLISGFGLKPYGGCMSMFAFQDFVVADQIHKESLALKACDVVPEEKILILYDRALLDDKAYVSDEEFADILSRVDGRTEAAVLANYDMVLHLVTCAKGAEYAYNYGNAARSESIEEAREMDDRTLRAWSGHHNLKVIDNAGSFEEKLTRAINEIYRAVGTPARAEKKRKFLVEMPDLTVLQERYGVVSLEMLQTYLVPGRHDVERRIRQQINGSDYLYFYTEKQNAEDGVKWETERPISQRDYIRYLMESDQTLPAVHKQKYRFACNAQRFELDMYPFSSERAILFCYGDIDALEIPPEITVIREVTDQPDYKNRALAERRSFA